ncbi:MAG: hypothetical protein K2I48_04545, partial [Muribaculaceae bacterium]|nr:hypothetical protein [Muribaculaceae bacterium]
NAAGLEVNKWLQTLKADTNEGFLQFIQGLSDKGGLDALAPLFKEMGESGIGAMNALGLLAGRIDKVREQQAAANDAFEKGISVTNEAAVANSTVAAGLAKSRKELDEVRIAVGERLMPVMTAANETATVSMRVIGWLVSVMMENRVALISLLATYALYSAAVNLAAIRTAALTLAQQAAAAASGAARVAGLALSSAMALLTGNVTRASAAWRLLTTTIKTTSGVAGIVVAVIGAVVAATASWISRVNAAAEAQRRHNETLRSYANQIRDVDREGTFAARKEVNRLKEIYDAATDEARSKRDRIAAAQELLRLYPSQFSRFTTEQIMLGNARKAYDDLTTSIINNAKARAAAEKVLENERKILDIEQEIEKKKDARADAQATLEQKEAANRARDSRAAESAKSFAGSIAMAGGSTAYVDRVDTSGDRAKIKEIDTEIKRSNEEVAELNKSTQRLTERFKSNEEFRKAYNAGDAPAAPTIPEITYTPSAGGASSSGGSGKESSTKSDSKKRAAEFRAGLDAIEKEWKEADAMTIGLYKTGSITLSEFQKRLHDSEAEMFDAKIEYYRQAGLEQDEDVADFRRKKEQSDLEYLRKYRKSSASEIKREQSQAELQAQIDYVTPGSDLYRDEEALQERLFRLKVYYLYRTRALYEENSEEYASLTEQAETAEQEERLRKEKATADLMLQYSEEYQLQESKRREEIEIATLDALHERGRLSEDEYQKALKEIREKYEKERANGGDSSGSSNTTAGFTASSEWGSMVVGLYDAFTMQLDATEDAATAWAKKISAIAQAAFAVVSSVSQQLAAYQSAVIDAESAKVSAAYDRRIKAASRNAKLQQRLEEQKEKALAKIKADATRRSFAMQVATAIAQTALNAILAATAAYQVGGIAGLVLAPIAAAMAVAAGAVQIATINKQREAALAGYSEGGFTSPGDVDEVAGVVHAGEWVA